MSAESLTQRWLRQNVSSYPHKDRVFVDVDAAIVRFAALRPKTDVYTYDDGRTQLLLCVHGLLPIQYRSVAYNIPIAVWITKDYPRAPPIVYVVPTQDMLVRPSKYVDVSGRCTIEYSQSWERKSEACNLSALFEALQDHFSHSPPLCAKPKPKLPSPRPASPVLSSPSSAPRSSSLLSPSHTSSPLPPQDAARPPLPPKPVSPPATVTTPSLPTYVSDLSHGPPPLPPRADIHPPQYQHPLMHISTGANIREEHSTQPPAVLATDRSASVGDNYRGPPEAMPVQSPLAHIRPPVFTQYPSHTTPRPPQQWIPSAVSPTSKSSPPNLIDDELVRSSVLQPPAESAPPRPPNPELLQLHARVHDKIQSEFNSLSQAMHLDAERLRAQQTDLLAGEPAIRDEMARLEAVRTVCRNVSSRFRSALEQGERTLSELRRKGDPEVDELVCSTSIVHNQLINLVADDNAIEDTMYHLHRALNGGRMDLERFLRTIRVLAEEQFMKRALIEKIQQGIPMEATLPYS
ncbi:UEV domain-containing protein [Pisolithus croceorrhizus]|nr:UEV domain-containing protein [Pisolithus croceorrhizus]KAI6109161.1 UEV domain-containing protein [Pisolithus croceorrhizus]